MLSDPPSVPLELDRFVPYRLSILSNRVSEAIARHYSARFDLSIPEWRIVAVLGATPGLSARDVAERTAMDKVQVSRAAARLGRMKRIQRQGDEGDGRVSRLSLTAKGRAIYEDIIPLALHLEARLLSVLSDAECKMLDRLMAKLLRQTGSLLETESRLGAARPVNHRARANS